MSDKVDAVMAKLRGELTEAFENDQLAAERRIASLSRPENERVADELEREAEFAPDAGVRDPSWCRVNRRNLQDWARRLREGR